MPDPRRGLPPQRRSRSLARLEAEIVRSGTACTRWRTRAEGLEAAGRDGRQARGLLHVAEGRLSGKAGARARGTGEPSQAEEADARHLRIGPPAAPVLLRNQAASALSGR